MSIELFILMIFIIIIFLKIFDYYNLKKEKEYNIESKAHFNSIKKASHATSISFFTLAFIIVIIHFLFLFSSNYLSSSDYLYSPNDIVLNIVLFAPIWGIPLFFLISSLSNSYFYYKLKAIEKEKSLTPEEKMELNYYSHKRIILLIIFIIIIAFYIYTFLSLVASPPSM